MIGNTNSKGHIAWNRLGEKPLTSAERQARHRVKKRAEYADMPRIPCLCGCGTLIAPIKLDGRPAKYANGHRQGGIATQFKKGHNTWNKGIRGSASTSWINGNSVLPYGSEFTRAFKKLIRERDGNKCHRCGAKKNGNRALEIHHIDFDKSNNDPTNLITLCGKCNRYFNFHQNESLIAFPKRKMLLI